MRHYVYEMVNEIEGIGLYTHFVDLPDDAPAPPNSTTFKPTLNEHVDTYFHQVGWRFGPKLSNITDEMVWRGFLNRIEIEVADMLRKAAGMEQQIVVQTWPMVAAACRACLNTDADFNGDDADDMIYEMAKADGRGLSAEKYAEEFMAKYKKYQLQVGKILGARDALIRQTKISDIPRITYEMFLM